MFKTVLALIVLIFSFNTVAITQKESLAQYTENALYGILFSDEFFDHELNVFKPNVLTDERLIREINGEQQHLIQDLFHSMVNDNTFPLIADEKQKQLWLKERRAIELRYSTQKTDELLAEMDCAAASIIDDFSCGYKIWNKLSIGTMANLTVNTLSMAPLVALDLVFPSATTARNAAKMSYKMPKSFLGAAHIVKNVTARAALASSNATTRMMQKIPILRVSLRNVASYAKLFDSNLFKLSTNILTVALNVGGDLHELSRNEKQQLQIWLNDLHGGIASYKASCEDNTEETCQYFDSLADFGVVDGIDVSTDYFVKTAALAVAALDNKLAILMVRLVSIGVIDPLTDENDFKLVETLLDVSAETGLTLIEFAPVVGPVMSWIRSIIAARNEMEENYNHAKRKYLLFVAARVSKLNASEIRYQLSTIEDSIHIVRNSINDVLFQITSPNALKINKVSSDSVRQSFDYTINEVDYYNILDKNSELQVNCDPNVTQLNSIVLSGVEYRVINDRCLSIEYAKLESANYKVIFTPRGALELTGNVRKGPLKTFRDIKANGEYTYDVNFLLSRGIIDERNSYFRPNDPISRAEFYAMFVRGLYPNKGVPNIDSWSTFYLDVLKDLQPFNSDIATNLDGPITALEVGYISIYDLNINWDEYFSIEAKIQRNCLDLDSSLLELTSKGYLKTSVNFDFTKCPYKIENNSQISRGQAANLIVNLIKRKS